MVSVLTNSGHNVRVLQPSLGTQQFSSVLLFVREVGTMLGVCLRDHKPGSFLYKSALTTKNNFIKVHHLLSYMLIDTVTLMVVALDTTVVCCSSLQLMEEHFPWFSVDGVGQGREDKKEGGEDSDRRKPDIPELSW